MRKIVPGKEVTDEAVFLVVLAAAMIFAQVDIGAVAGVVTDRSEAIIPNVDVVIIQQETN
jgi:hypothetical protein